MPEKRATSRVERAIMLSTAFKPDRMGAERARLLNKEQRRPSVVTSDQRSVSQRSGFLRITPPTKRQKSFALSARVSSFERDRPPGGPPLVTPQLKGRPARRAVNKEQRRPFVVAQIRDQRSDFLRITPPTKRQKSFALSARVPSFERDRPPGGLPLVTPQLNGGPARRAVKDFPG